MIIIKLQFLKKKYLTNIPPQYNNIEIQLGIKKMSTLP